MEKFTKDLKFMCKCDNKNNNKNFDPLLTSINYESSKIITDFSLPRKYTTSHNDNTMETYVSIGKTYNNNILSNEESIKTESQVIGKWELYKGKYIIHLSCYVSTSKNPQSTIRNQIFCAEMWRVLKSISLSESSLLKLYPKLADTKIYIHFKSIDPQYDRYENWCTLGYWSQ